MPEAAEISLIQRKYRDVFGASVAPAFGAYLTHGSQEQTGAALGYRRADERPLFLERYLDLPIEECVSEAFGRSVERNQIVEIGNFAVENAMMMIEFWGAAANDLAGAGEVAVATLTAPLRRIFARIGIPVTVLAPARRERMGDAATDWGSYYECDPQVCAGLIMDGQGAIATFLQRRIGRQAA